MHCLITATDKNLRVSWVDSNMLSRMQDLDRRSLLIAFGVASVTRLASAQAENVRRVAIAKPNENRFTYKSFDFYLTPACKVTGEDSGDTISLMELTVP